MFFHISRGIGEAFTARMEPGCQDLLRFDLGPDERIEFLGDPVLRDRSAMPGGILGADGRVDVERLFDQVPGHYYWFHWHGDTLDCGSSFCGILPVWWRSIDGQLDISSSSFHIARTRGLKADDRRYLLERRLFHYPLFDRSPWKTVRLLPADSKLSAGPAGVDRVKCSAIEAYFSRKQGEAGADMDALHDAFERECDLHIPAKGSAISFTGGFDGRTLLAAALKLRRSVPDTYGFGLPGESDIAMPAEQARSLGVRYTPILLGTDYLDREALPSALAFMDLSDHAGNLGRPHYHYAARLLCRSYTHLVTGNFGSELFRALHAPGAMMTEHLIGVFGGGASDRERALREAAGPEFSAEVDELITEVEHYLGSSIGLNPSQRFYRFVFDELFRKYFGPEIVVQTHFLRNRTPFLSWRFVKTLLGTRWAGVHSRLFETDKRRRMKGQVFYASFIRHAAPRLYRMPTNKGYAPPDVLEKWRYPLLMVKLLWKRFITPEKADSNSIDAFSNRFRADMLAHYGLSESAGEDLQGLSVRAAWAAAEGVD